MNQIAPHRLWIGHAGEARDFRTLFDSGIKAVVELALEEPPSQTPRELIACRFPLLDGAGNDPEVLELALRTVAALVRAQVPTLVCCGGGMSRSPAVAAAGLALARGTPPEECLQRVVAHHPCDVSPGLWNEVTALLPALTAPAASK
jgi:protein-tyrosine phosphatase